jgi:predicted dehydrogenase
MTLNRRQFLGTTAAAAMAAGYQARAAEDNGKPMEAVLIGAGAFGRSQMRAAYAAGNVKFVALCDVDSAQAEETQKLVQENQDTKAQYFKDYRELLDKVDAPLVFIATPPHWHALPFIAACEKGRDIYCDKPLAYDIREGQAMIEAAKKAGNIVQIGFQRRSSDILPAVRDYLKSGNLGELVQVEPYINYGAPRLSREPEDPPATLDWDFWCGPAPLLPYSPAVGHYYWRLEKTTGNGHLVDWGIHLVDAARTILDESMPKTVRSSGGIYDMAEHITTPDAMTATWEFETCPFFWHHRIWGGKTYSEQPHLGVSFYCKDGTIFMEDHQWTIVPAAKDKQPEVKKSNIQPSNGGFHQAMLTKHVGDFFESVKTRKPPACLIEDAWKSTSIVQMAMIALETGSALHWNPDTVQFENNAAANERLKRAYRGSWKHPFDA